MEVAHHDNGGAAMAGAVRPAVPDRRAGDRPGAHLPMGIPLRWGRPCAWGQRDSGRRSSTLRVKGKSRAGFKGCPCCGVGGCRRPEFQRGGAALLQAWLRGLASPVCPQTMRLARGLHCREGQETAVIQHGTTPEGRQRYRCHTGREGRGQTFLLVSAYRPPVSTECCEQSVASPWAAGVARVRSCDGVRRFGSPLLSDLSFDELRE